MKKKLLSVLFLFLSKFIFAEVTSPVPVDTVTIGAYVISLHDINFRDKEYTMRYWLWMKYKNPKLDFANTVEVPYAKSIENPDIMVDSSTNIIWVLMKMTNVMKKSWNVQDYPFDHQEIDVIIENSKFDIRSVVFKADTSGNHFDPKFTIDGWEIRNFSIKIGNHVYMTDFGDTSLNEKKSTYATFDIHFELVRNAWGLFFKIFIGMYIAFGIAAVSLLLKIDFIESRFGLTVGGLFAAVGNKYIIDSLLPESSNFTLVDSLHAITFICILIIVIYSAALIHFQEKGFESVLLNLKRKGIISILCFYVLSNILLITLALIN